MSTASAGILNYRTPDFAPFGFYLPIAKAVVEESTGDWLIEGPLSEPGADLQRDEMDMAGLRKGLSTFMALGGVVDWEHLYEKTRDPDAIIGKGIALFDAPHPLTGVIVPWLRVRLYKSKALARKAWEHLQAGGSLGFSVAGAALRKAGAKIVETMITTVGATALPVVSANSGTLRVMKALCALEGYDGLLRDVTLPMVPELAGDVLPLFRALQAGGELPPAGPGCNALTVEDLGAEGRTTGRKVRLPDEEEDDEDEEPKPRGKRRRLASSTVRKALDFALSERLGDCLAARGAR